MGGSEYDSWEYCGQGGDGGQVGWKLDSGEAKPHELCEELKVWKNYGHKMGGMGYNHSDKTIPAH